MLALVLTLVFGLSTFHGHAEAGLGLDVTMTVAIDVEGGPAEKSPSKDERHDSSDCPLCALHSHILGVASTELDVALVAVAARFALASERGCLQPPSELHRPPIDAAK